MKRKWECVLVAEGIEGKGENSSHSPGNVLFSRQVGVSSVFLHYLSIPHRFLFYHSIFLSLPVNILCPPHPMALRRTAHFSFILCQSGKFIWFFFPSFHGKGWARPPLLPLCATQVYLGLFWTLGVVSFQAAQSCLLVPYTEAVIEVGCN